MTEFTGALRERVSIERWAGAPDDSGGEVGAWGAAVDAWAEVSPAGTGLPNVAEQPARNPRYRVRMRGSGRADLNCRLRWRGRQLAVLSASPDPAADRIELLVEERAA